jgi:lipoprotein NlpI
VIALFYQLFRSIGNFDVNIEVFEKLIRILKKYEKELVNRGIPFFAGK